MYSIGRINILEERDIKKLNSAIFDVLENIGIKVENEILLKILSQKGLNVKKEERIVKFRPNDIIDIIEYQKKRTIKEKLSDNNYATQVAALIAPFYYDFDKKEKRYATKVDLINMIRFSDARGDKVSLPLTVKDFDPMIEPIESLALLVKYAHFPASAYAPYTKSTACITTFASSALQIKYIAKINELIYGKPVPPRGPDFMTSPLTMGNLTAEYLLEVRKYEVPFYCIGVQPISGMDAPLSISGSIVIGACEILGAWIITNALVPEPNLTGAICSGITDTRKAIISFNAPEAILQNVGVVELFDKMYGGHVGIAAGNDYIDAKIPGFEALYERVYRALAIAAFTGRSFFVGGSGALDQGRIFSPVQFLLDEEIGNGFWQFTQGIPLDEESIRLETLQEIVFSGKSFMETDHTLRNCRKAFWLPELLDRNVWVDLKTELGREDNILEKANKKFKMTINKYEQPEYDPSLIKEVNQILEEARSNLVKN